MEVKMNTISSYVNSFDPYEAAQGVVSNLHPGSDYYEILTKEAPDDFDAKVQFLMDLWTTEGMKGRELYRKIKHFYTLKQKKEKFIDNVEPDDLDISREFEQFRLFEEEHDLIPWDLSFYFIDPVKKLGGWIQGLFCSETDNYAGVHLKMYYWTRTKDLRREYGKFSSDVFGTMPDNRFNRISVQLNFYRLNMERFHNKIIDEMSIVAFRPDTDSYKIHKVDRLQENNYVYAKFKAEN